MWSARWSHISVIHSLSSTCGGAGASIRSIGWAGIDSLLDRGGRGIESAGHRQVNAECRESVVLHMAHDDVRNHRCIV